MSLTIRQFETTDAAHIANFISSQSPEYLRFFYAFDSDEPAIAEMLSAAEKDVYAGVFWQDNLAGIIFLRGWDEGYEIPSFGILIDENYRGATLKNLTLEYAKAVCRLSGVNQLMAKMHPENTPLKNVHRLGFYRTGIEESTGNVIFHLDF